MFWTHFPITDLLGASGRRFGAGVFLFLLSIMVFLLPARAVAQDGVVRLGGLTSDQMARFMIEAISVYGQLDMSRVRDGNLVTLFEPGRSAPLNEFERHRLTERLHEVIAAAPTFWNGAEGNPLLQISFHVELSEYDFAGRRYSICLPTEMRLNPGPIGAIFFEYPPHIQPVARYIIGACSGSSFLQLEDFHISMDPEDAEMLLNESTERREVLVGRVDVVLVHANCVLHQTNQESANRQSAYRHGSSAPGNNPMNNPTCSVQQLDFVVSDAALRRDLMQLVVWGEHAPNVVSVDPFGQGLVLLNPSIRTQRHRRAEEERQAREQAELDAERQVNEAERLRQEFLDRLPRSIEIVHCDTGWSEPIEVPVGWQWRTNWGRSLRMQFMRDGEWQDRTGGVARSSSFRFCTTSRLDLRLRNGNLTLSWSQL